MGAGIGTVITGAPEAVGMGRSIVSVSEDSELDGAGNRMAPRGGGSATSAAVDVVGGLGGWRVVELEPGPAIMVMPWSWLVSAWDAAVDATSAVVVKVRVIVVVDVMMLVIAVSLPPSAVCEMLLLVALIFAETVVLLKSKDVVAALSPVPVLRMILLVATVDVVMTVDVIFAARLLEVEVVVSAVKLDEMSDDLVSAAVVDAEARFPLVVLDSVVLVISTLLSVVEDVAGGVNGSPGWKSTKDSVLTLSRAVVSVCVSRVCVIVVAVLVGAAISPLLPNRIDSMTWRISRSASPSFPRPPPCPFPFLSSSSSWLICSPLRPFPFNRSSMRRFSPFLPFRISLIRSTLRLGSPSILSPWCFPPACEFWTRSSLPAGPSIRLSLEDSPSCSLLWPDIIGVVSTRMSSVASSLCPEALSMALWSS